MLAIKFGFFAHNFVFVQRHSNALCPVRPPQTAIGRPAGTWLGRAPVPVAVFGVAPKTARSAPVPGRSNVAKQAVIGLADAHRRLSIAVAGTATLRPRSSTSNRLWPVLAHGHQLGLCRGARPSRWPFPASRQKPFPKRNGSSNGEHSRPRLSGSTPPSNSFPPARCFQRGRWKPHARAGVLPPFVHPKPILAKTPMFLWKPPHCDARQWQCVAAQLDCEALQWRCQPSHWHCEARQWRRPAARFGLLTDSPPPDRRKA